MENRRETINDHPEEFIRGLADAVRPFLNTRGNERRRIRNRFLVCLYRLGYCNRAFYTGPRLRDIDPECAEFFDITKDPKED